MGKPAYLIFDHSYTGERNTLMKMEQLSSILCYFKYKSWDDNENIHGTLYYQFTDEDAYLSRYDDFLLKEAWLHRFGVRRTGSKPRVLGMRIRYRY